MTKSTQFLFNFESFIEKQRGDKKKKTIQKYEKIVLKGKTITGSIKRQKWYRDYLSKFKPIPKYRIPDDLKNDFDWDLLFRLVAGSFSSTYRLSNTTKIDANTEIPDLIITVSNKDQRIEKAISELWSFQIHRLFEIYINEQIELEIGLNQKSFKKGISLMREQKKDEFNTITNLYCNPKKPQKGKNDIAAHYCSLESAFHIIKSGKMFASDLSYMNDETELTFGIDIMITALKQIVKEKKLDPAFKKELKKFINNSSKLKKNLEDSPVYISCLSRKEDDLNQWRAYGDNGYGVSIVFDFDITRNDTLSDGFIMDDIEYLGEKYDSNKKKVWDKLKNTIRNEFLKSFNNKSNSNTLDEISYLLGFLTTDLLTNLRFYKNEFFHEEEEYRLVCLNQDQQYKRRTRVRDNYLIPYIDLNVCNIKGQSSIVEIIIGPSIKDFDKAKKSFERFINDLNIEKAIEKVKNVIYSKIKQMKDEPISMSKNALATLKSNINDLEHETSIVNVLSKASESFQNFLKTIEQEGLSTKSSKRYFEETKDELEEQLKHTYLNHVTIRHSTVPYLP